MANPPYISSTQVASSVPFDITGLPFDGTDVQTAITELRQNIIWDPEYVTTTANGTLTLLDSNRALQILSGTATGYTVVLPSALTLNVGEHFTIVNSGSQPMTVKDGGGNILFTLAQTSIGFLILQAAGSAAGTWLYWQTFIGIASGVVNYNIISSTNFTSSANADTLITGMSVTPQAGTYAVWFSAQNTGSGSGQALNVTLYKGAAAIPDSIRIAASPAGGHAFFNGTQTIAQFDGATACSAYVNPNGNSMTVNQRSLLLIRLGT